MKKSMLPVFLCVVLIFTTVLGQLPPVGVDAVSNVSSPSTDGSNTTWDCIYFGKYWKNDTNNDGTADQKDEREKIKWRVLSVKDHKAILMSEQILDACEFDGNWADDDAHCLWKASAIRTWLNQTFYNAAFSSAEQNIIQTSTVNDVNNPLTGQMGGGETEDKVYLLSTAEAVREDYGFDSELRDDSETRAATATAYASSNGDLKKWYLLTR